MAFEVTFNCDICGTVGGAESTATEARKSAKEEGWSILRIDDRIRCICPICRESEGGTNAVRRTFRKGFRVT